MAFDQTMNYNVEKDNEQKKTNTKKVLKEVYASLIEKGYNPIKQLVGYVLSGDPTYITSHKNARVLISSIDRDELLEFMLREYLELD